MSTLTVPSSVPSPAEDCEQLHQAFEGWGTNEKLIISILAHRNAQQRQLIRQTYAEIYGKNLFKELDKELSGDFDSAVFLWTLDPPERDAVLAHEAVKKWHPGSLVLIEIACTRSSKDLFLARQAYHESFKRSIEEDVASCTKGSFRKLLVPLVSAYRYEGLEVNMTLAKTEAKKLHEKISEKTYDDEEVIHIVTTRSKAQLGATFNYYIDQFGNSIDQDLETTEKDDFVSALRSTICCLISPEKHFEEVLRLAINGLGTDEAALTRVVTTRAEVDMEVIKEQYYKRNSVPLEKAILGDTSGDYEAMLLALIGYANA